MARKILDFMQDISFSSNDYFDKEKRTMLCVKFLSHLCCCFFYQLCHFLQLHIVFYGIQLFHCFFILLVLCNLCRYSNLNVKVLIVNILLLFVEPNILSIVFDYIQLFFCYYFWINSPFALYTFYVKKIYHIWLCLICMYV